MSSGNDEYDIELLMQHIAITPDDIRAHRALRKLALERMAQGGKSLGIVEKMKLTCKSSDAKQNMLNAERLLAYDPENMDHMMALMQAAYIAECEFTFEWIKRIIRQAGGDC